jgi:hypothetical protein
MTRDTSRASYDRLVAEGSLKGKQKRIMDLLIEMGTATSGEVLVGVSNVNAWRGRFTELQQRGLIREVAVRPCKISGRECIVWAPTGRDKPLDAKAGAGGVTHALSSRKKGRWQACAMKLAHVIEQLRRLEIEGRGLGIVGQNPANTAHLRAEASRALAEYTRLGGTVPA